MTDVISSLGEANSNIKKLEIKVDERFDKIDKHFDKTEDTLSISVNYLKR
ncbi:hypothetical protein [Endozoicomonas sp. 2B-B]